MKKIFLGIVLIVLMFSFVGIFLAREVGIKETIEGFLFALVVAVCAVAGALLIAHGMVE